MTFFRTLRLELLGDAWVDYDPHFLDADAASLLMGELITECDWEARTLHVMGKKVTQPRLMAWAGSVPYHYSGQTLFPLEPGRFFNHYGIRLRRVRRRPSTTWSLIITEMGRITSGCMQTMNLNWVRIQRSLPCRLVQRGASFWSASESLAENLGPVFGLAMVRTWSWEVRFSTPGVMRFPK